MSQYIKLITFVIVILSLSSGGYAQQEIAPSDDSANFKAVNGKYYLITSTTLHSFGQGLMISTLLNDPFETSTSRKKFSKAFPYMISAVGLTTSILATQNKWINPAAANTHFWGSSLGYFHGLGLTWAVTDNLEVSNDAGFAYYVGLFSLVEGWAGYFAAKGRKIDYARSMSWNSGNAWGLVAGYLLYNSFSESESARYSGISMLGGSALGILGANALQTHYPRSSGDWRAINAAGFIGSVIGLSVIDEVKSDRTLHSSILITSAAAIAGAHMFTRRTTFTKSQGAMISIGTGGGALMGAVVSYMIGTEMFSSLLITGGAAAAGWGITYAYHRSQNKKQSKGLGLEKDRSGGFNFHVNPTGFGMLKMSEAQQIRMLQQNIPAGMAGVKLTW